MSTNYIANDAVVLSASGVDRSPYLLETGAIPSTWYGGKVSFATTGQPTFMGTTAPPAAGAATSGILVSSTAALGIYWGSGAPTFSAAQGSLYIRTDGASISTRLHVNTNGTTGWTNFTSAT